MADGSDRLGFGIDDNRGGHWRGVSAPWELHCIAWALHSLILHSIASIVV
jgi:hypothetical protein